MNRLFWIIGLAIALVAFMVLMAGSTWGQDLDIPIDTIHSGAPGELFLEGEVAVQSGDKCVAVLTWTNNIRDPSDHPNTDILVGPITFFDVERGINFTATASFTATGIVEVYTRLGGDGISSGGGNLEVTCNPPTTSSTKPDTPPTTTVVTSTVATSTTQSPPPSATSTTLSPPPVGGVATGGGVCADGACDGWQLTTKQTWLGIGVVWALLAGLAWAAIAGATRRADG